MGGAATKIKDHNYKPGVKWGQSMASIPIEGTRYSYKSVFMQAT